MNRATIPSHEIVAEYRRQGHPGSPMRAIADPLVRQAVELAVRARTPKLSPPVLGAKCRAANDIE